MDIQRIRESVWSYNHVEYVWTDPTRVIGYSREETRQLNIRAFGDGLLDLYDIDGEGRNASADALITDYLRRCLVRRGAFKERGDPWPPCLNASPIEVFSAALFLMVELYSYFPVIAFASCADAINETIAEHVAQQLKTAYLNSRSIVLDTAVREYALDAFGISTLVQDAEPGFRASISEDSADFLRKLKLDPRSLRLGYGTT